MKSKKTVTVTLDAYGNHSIKCDDKISEDTPTQINNTAGQSQTMTAPTVNTVGNTHLGTKQGQLLSMFGTLDTAGHMDIPPSATKVFAT